MLLPSLNILWESKSLSQTTHTTPRLWDAAWRQAWENIKAQWRKLNTYKHLKPHKVKKSIMWNANMHFHLNTTSAKGDLNAFTEILCNHVSPQQFWPRTQK